MDSLEGDPLTAIWDLEISPTTGTFWGSKYETNIIEVTHEWVILSFSIKFSDGRHITKGLCDYKGKGMDDKRIVQDLHRLLEPVEILVHQNGDKFDVKKLNARFVIHGLGPLSPKKTVDTLKVARNKFGFTSNKLDDLGEILGLGRKLEHEGYGLWKKCMAGDRKAWKRMKDYNAQDVLLTEKVYKRFLPFISNHPNMDSYSVKTVCPKCSSKHIVHRGYTIISSGTKYARIQCMKCGGWCQSPVNLGTKKPLKSL